MTHKEFIAELSSRLASDTDTTSRLIASLLADMGRQLENGGSVMIQGFGSFDIKKKTERISVNPTTKLRLLVPPKLVLTFKPSNVLKEKFK